VDEEDAEEEGATGERILFMSDEEVRLVIK